jgi:KaiC/GvpD/RAD55 family RecA-like ATPase
MKKQNEFSQKKSLIETAGDLLARTIPKPIPILDGLINEGSIGMIAGDTGAGKSWLVMHYAYCVSAGKLCRPWGEGAAKPVLYIDGEMGESLFQKRYSQIRNRDINAGTLALGKKNLYILGRAWSEDIEDLDKPAVQKKLDKYVEELGIKLVIIDNLDTLCPEALSKQTAWKALIDWIQELSRKHVAVVLVHHNNKAGKQYGSSVKTRQMHYVVSLKKLPQPKNDEQTYFSLSMEKQRDEGIGLEEDTRFVVTTTYDEEAEKTTTTVKIDELYVQKTTLREQVKQHFVNGKNGKEIAELLAISESKVTRIKAFLKQQGELE